MLTIFLLLAIGTLFLFFGGDFLVKGAASFALRKGVAMMVVGLTIVSMGTSAPELFVSLAAQIKGNTDISLGNIIGSNIANIGLVLGISAITRPISVSRNTLKFDMAFVALSTILLWAVLADGVISRFDSVILLITFAAFLAYCFMASKTEKQDGEVGILRKTWMEWVFIIGGIAVLYAGSEMFIAGAVKLAQRIGMSEFFIGLTIVAVGTSLPELATSVVAAMRGNSDISLGNVLGSNVFNVFFILGLVGLIMPIQGAASALTFDMPLLLCLSFILWPLCMSGRLTRRGGLMLCAVYAVYVFVIAIRG